MATIALRTLIGCVTLLLLGNASTAAPETKTAPKKFTVMLAYFTATPKPLKPGQARDKNLSILPVDGVSFTLDTSTPVRFRKQMESVSKQYEYSLDLAGSVVCVSGAEAQTELRILPDPKDSNRLQMTGLVWISQLQPHIVKLALTSIGAFVARPGVKQPIKVFGLDTTRSVVLGRTYVVGYQQIGKDKDAPIALLAVSVVPAG